LKGLAISARIARLRAQSQIGPANRPSGNKTGFREV
jgi:hypothetical protein